MPSIKVAKATERDIHGTRDFMQAAELALEVERFSLSDAAAKWRELDSDDDDWKLIIHLRKELAEELDIDQMDVDDRLTMYEFLKEKFRRNAIGWQRTVIAADVLIDNVCDPTGTVLDFHPGFDFNHVAAEQ